MGRVGPEVWRLQKICEQGLDPLQGGLQEGMTSAHASGADRFTGV